MRVTNEVYKAKRAFATEILTVNPTLTNTEVGQMVKEKFSSGMENKAVQACRPPATPAPARVEPAVSKNPHPTIEIIRAKREFLKTLMREQPELTALKIHALLKEKYGSGMRLSSIRKFGKSVAHPPKLYKTLRAQTVQRNTVSVPGPLMALLMQLYRELAAHGYASAKVSNNGVQQIDLVRVEEITIPVGQKGPEARV